MANITAAMVKELREKTGAGMMDCKNRPQRDGRRHRGRGRLAAQEGPLQGRQEGRPRGRRGPRGGRVVGPQATILEVNSETDFVARNDQFQAFAREAAKIALMGDGTSSPSRPPISRARRPP
jgi:elongation factor Ts